ncbi:unnamed protein product, partial [Strongylus vulgaris]
RFVVRSKIRSKVFRPPEKAEVSKAELVRPLPPPLPNAAARKVPPSSPLVALPARKPHPSPSPASVGRPIVKEEPVSKEYPDNPGPSQVLLKTKTLELVPSNSTPGRLPAKKELLSRARQGVPVEMRSPPAHTSIAATSLFSRYSVDDYESDGSASPELGVDDVPQSLLPSTPSQAAAPLSSPTPDLTSATSLAPTPSPSKSQIARTLTPPPKRVPVPQPPHRSTSQRSVPAPPPLPRKEKVVKTPERTASPVVKQENVKPVVKSEEEKPAERFRFKPQVPRPTPVSPLKPAVPKREAPVEPGLGGKDVNCKEIRNHFEENEKS